VNLPDNSREKEMAKKSGLQFLPLGAQSSKETNVA
jgi:hypothetical protein